MRFITIFLFIFVGKQINCLSQVLLVPAEMVPFEQYKLQCQKEGYLCTINEDLRKIQQSETPLFNEFVNQLDYGSDEFKKTLLKELASILEKEALSFEQLEIMLQILHQLKNLTSSFQEQKKISLMENELQSIYDLITKNELRELPASYFILFKKAISLDTIKKVKITFSKIVTFKSDFKRSLSTTSTRLLQLAPSEVLLTGRCETARIHPSVEVVKWQAYQDEACGFSDRIKEVSQSTGSFLNRNKTFITLGAMVLGTALLLNQYEIKFTF